MSDNDVLFQRLTKFIEESNRKQTETIREEIKNQLERVKEDVGHLQKTVKEETEKRMQIEQKLERQEELNEQVQRALKKNNIIVWDLEYEDSSNLSELVLSTINKLLGLSLAVSHCNNIYPLGGGQNPRPVVIQFVSYLTKQQILKESGKLKNIKGKTISISEDLTRGERAVRKILVKHKKLAVSQGHKAHIKGIFLFVNGEKYTADSLEDQPGEQEHLLQKSNSAPPTPSVQHRNQLKNSSESDTEIFIEETKGKTKEQTDEAFIKVQNSVFQNQKQPSSSSNTQGSLSGYSLRQQNKDTGKTKVDKEKPKARSKSSVQSSPSANISIKSSHKR